MKHILNFKLFENNNDNILDINSSIYLENSKSIIACYQIIEDNERSIKVLNVQEWESPTSVALDGSSPIQFDAFYTILPKSQIKILDDEVNEEYVGFKYIEIPYWLYKKNIKQLIIKRLGRDFKRRGVIDIPGLKVNSQQYMDKFINDKNIREQLIILGNKIEKYDFYINWYKRNNNIL